MQWRQQQIQGWRCAVGHFGTAEEIRTVKQNSSGTVVCILIQVHRRLNQLDNCIKKVQSLLEAWSRSSNPFLFMTQSVAFRLQHQVFTETGQSYDSENEYLSSNESQAHVFLNKREMNTWALRITNQVFQVFNSTHEQKYTHNAKKKSLKMETRLSLSFTISTHKQQYINQFEYGKQNPLAVSR